LGKKTHPASNPTLQFARSGAFVPSRTRVSLRFAISQTAAASGTYAQLSVSGNNCFDPGLSLSSGQCVGFDYWASMYERYRVIGSSIHVQSMMQINAAGGGLEVAGTVCVFPATATASLASMNDAQAQPYAKTKDTTAATQSSIRSVMKTSTICGIKNMEGADQLQALISAGPANEWFWNIGIISGAAYTNYFTDLDFIVTYDVEFFDRAQINRSSLEAIHKAYLANCLAVEAKYQDLTKLRQKAQDRFKEELEKERKHVTQIKDSAEEFEEAYKKMHKIFEPVELKKGGFPSLAIADNQEVHEKWLKLRLADELARTPNPTPKSSSKK
jgi:hypothetical protein